MSESTVLTDYVKLCVKASGDDSLYQIIYQWSSKHDNFLKEVNEAKEISEELDHQLDIHEIEYYNDIKKYNTLFLDFKSKSKNFKQKDIELLTDPVMRLVDSQIKVKKILQDMKVDIPDLLIQSDDELVEQANVFVRMSVLLIEATFKLKNKLARQLKMSFIKYRTIKTLSVIARKGIYLFFSLILFTLFIGLITNKIDEYLVKPFIKGQVMIIIVTYVAIPTFFWILIENYASPKLTEYLKSKKKSAFKKSTDMLFRNKFMLVCQYFVLSHYLTARHNST